MSFAWCVFLPTPQDTNIFPHNFQADFRILYDDDDDDDDDDDNMFVLFIIYCTRSWRWTHWRYLICLVSSLKIVFSWNPVSGSYTENCMLHLWSCILVIYHPYLIQSPSFTLVGIWVIVHCVENINVDIWIYTFNFITIYWLLQLPGKCFCSETCHSVMLFAERFVPLFFVLCSLGQMSGFI